MISRASRVDVKKLEKQEAKLRAKIEKRARRDLYEGSKLLDQYKKQVREVHCTAVVHRIDHAPSNRTKRCSCKSTRSTPLRHPRTSRKISICRLSMSILGPCVSCASHTITVWCACVLTGDTIQVWCIAHPCSWAALWSHRTQRYRKVHTAAPHRNA